MPDRGLPLEAGFLGGVLVLLLPEQLGLAPMEFSWFCRNSLACPSSAGWGAANMVAGALGA